MLAIPSAGVNWLIPPNGINTVLAPMVESNLWTNPDFTVTFKSVNIFNHLFSKLLMSVFLENNFGSVTHTLVSCKAPFVFKNSRLISTIASSFQIIFKRGVLVTFATIVASKFSSNANWINFLAFAFSKTTAILSCDSLIANSVPSKFWYFFGIALRLISIPSHNSPIATLTPPAPKSLHLIIIFETVGFLKNLWIFLSSTGLPFWTCEPHVRIEVFSWTLLLPVAPPIPSLPVLPPNKITTSPGFGVFLTTLAIGAAAITAPVSKRLAT